MQAGAGFNEHRVSHQVLQKRTASSRATYLSSKHHNQGESHPWLKSERRRGKSATTPKGTSSLALVSSECRARPKDDIHASKVLH